MYKKIVSSLMGFALLFALEGCSNETFDCDCDDAVVEIGFSLSKPATSTRSLGTVDSKESANRIENFQILVFDESGFLEKSMYTNDTNIDHIVKMKVNSGIKDFYAVANVGKELTGISNKQDFVSKISNIEEQQQPLFVMVAQRFGEKVANDGKAYTFTLIVERLVARVRLQYETDFSDTYYENKEFVLDSVYILNGNSRCTYSFMEEKGSVSSSVLRSGQAGGSDFLNSFLQTGHWKATPVGFYSNKYFYFYVFPNMDGKAPTKIILSALLDGERTYYPITVNKPDGKVDWGDSKPHNYVRRNNDYKIRATITGKGGEGPEVEVEYVNILLGVSCVDWSEAWQEDDFKE